MFTVNGKEVIVLGDKTTHGEAVVSASGNVFHLGIPIARIGDEVTCPKCGGTHQIVEGAPTAFANNLNIALHGDAVSCGATLIAGSAQASSVNGKISAPASQNFEAPALTPEHFERPVETVNSIAHVKNKEIASRFVYVSHKDELVGSSMAVIYKGGRRYYDFPPISAGFSIISSISVDGRKLRIFSNGKTGVSTLPNLQ